MPRTILTDPASSGQPAQRIADLNQTGIGCVGKAISAIAAAPIESVVAQVGGAPPGTRFAAVAEAQIALTQGLNDTCRACSAKLLARFRSG